MITTQRALRVGLQGRAGLRRDARHRERAAPLMAGIGAIAGISSSAAPVGPMPAGVKAPETEQQKALYESCKQFEAVFVRQIVSGWMKSARRRRRPRGRRRASTRTWPTSDDQEPRRGRHVRPRRHDVRPAGRTLGAVTPTGRRRPARSRRAGGAIAGGAGGMNPALGQLIAVLRAQADSLEQALELTERQTDAIVRRELDRINRAVAEPRAARSSRAASWRSAGSASPPSWPTRSAWSAGDVDAVDARRRAARAPRRTRCCERGRR